MHATALKLLYFWANSGTKLSEQGYGKVILDLELRIDLFVLESKVWEITVINSHKIECKAVESAVKF